MPSRVTRLLVCAETKLSKLVSARSSVLPSGPRRSPRLAEASGVPVKSGDLNTSTYTFVSGSSAGP